MTPDVDDDGVRDLLVGTPRGVHRTLASLHSGRNGRYLRSIDAPAVNRRLLQVAAAGDVDGDGFPDVVGAYYDREIERVEWPAREKRFRIVICSGRDGRVLRDTMEEMDAPGDLHELHDVGDLDGDGCSDLFVAQTMMREGKGAHARICSGKTGTVLADMTCADWSFGVSAANVGDLDGDGRPEIVVGRHEYRNCRGCAYVISLGQP